MDAPNLHGVLVIGGCGCLGHHIVMQLVADHNTSNITIFHLSTEHTNVEEMTYIQGSQFPRNAILSIHQQIKPHIIIHTASPKLIIQSNTRQLYHDVNITGPNTLSPLLLKWAQPKHLSTPPALQ